MSRRRSLATCDYAISFSPELKANRLDPGRPSGNVSFSNGKLSLDSFSLKQVEIKVGTFEAALTLSATGSHLVQ